jgi:hypothetical protein
MYYDNLGKLLLNLICYYKLADGELIIIETKEETYLEKTIVKAVERCAGLYLFDCPCKVVVDKNIWIKIL